MDLKFYRRYIISWATTLIVNEKSDPQSKLVEKFNYSSYGFVILQKTEPLYFADISCCTHSFELKFGDNLDTEIWSNFGIQLMS